MIALLLVITLISFISTNFAWYFPLELLSHFQLQYFTFNCFICVSFFFRRKKNLFLASLAVLSLQSTYTLNPFIPHLNVISGTTETVKVLFFNLEAQSESETGLIPYLKQERPDIAVFAEAETKGLDKTTKLFPFFYKKQGIIILSKLPIENTEILPNQPQSKPILTADVLLKNYKVKLVAAHPSVPIRQERFHTRNKQFDAIARYVNSQQQPVVLIGDLNSSMWSPYYKRLQEKSGLNNARTGFGIIPTWPTPNTYSNLASVQLLTNMFAIPIDHCLVSDEIKVRNIYSGKDLGSDHLPLIVELEMARHLNS